MALSVVAQRPDELLGTIRSVVKGADDALLCVAFSNEAGINLLAPAIEPSARVRLLSTTVFGDSTTAALAKASVLGIEVRVLNLPRGTYHPKLYLGRRGTYESALVGSANLTSGLLRNIEVGALLTGPADEQVLATLRELGEEWWAHPAATAWTPTIVAPPADQFVADLRDELTAALRPGMTVLTITDQRPNRIVEISDDAIWIETERSRRHGRGAEPVPAWMFNIAWDYLVAHGCLTNSYLLATDGLNVKRSSAVCAILATLPSVEVANRRPIELCLASAASSLAAEQRPPYR